MNACWRNKSDIKPEPSTKFKQKCGACSGYSYTPSNVAICNWCDTLCHKKCVKGQLGCLACCATLYPGYACTSWELTGDPNFCNDKIFNPYDLDNLTNLIGDKVENEIEYNCMWQEVSDFLKECKYKQLKDITKSKHGELKTFNLNIRSLPKYINALREKIDILQKYDVLCLNETSCDLSKLPHGINDILLDGFHAPITRSPTRSSNKGGGLAIYVNKSVCNEDSLDDLELEKQPFDPNGEFLFVKVSNCKNTEKTVIVGNVYRSPSNSTQKFLDLYEHILQKLDKHKTKQVIISGDFNIDLIKHETDTFSQNLLDLTTKYGLAQTISRPTRITDTSATLIDHVYTNMISKVVTTSVITLDLTDHLATSITVSLDANFDSTKWNKIGRIYSKENRNEYRIFNVANSEKFTELINNENWDIPEGLDSQKQYDHFQLIYI